MVSRSHGSNVSWYRLADHRGQHKEPDHRLDAVEVRGLRAAGAPLGARIEHPRRGGSAGEMRRSAAAAIVPANRFRWQTDISIGPARLVISGKVTRGRHGRRSGPPLPWIVPVARSSGGCFPEEPRLPPGIADHIPIVAGDHCIVGERSIPIIDQSWANAILFLEIYEISGLPGRNQSILLNKYVKYNYIQIIAGRNPPCPGVAGDVCRVAGSRAGSRPGGPTS
jgi:hypothetical protein